MPALSLSGRAKFAPAIIGHGSEAINGHYTRIEAKTKCAALKQLPPLA